MAADAEPSTKATRVAPPVVENPADTVPVAAATNVAAPDGVIVSAAEASTNCTRVATPLGAKVEVSLPST
jgi:FAD/FMN-containing dehydrogenase